MHILGGFHPGGSLNRICAYLGILDKLEIRHTDADAMDAILYGEDGSCYTLPTGKDAFTRYLQQQFPADSEGIKRYMDAMYALSYEVDAFYLRSSEMSLFSHSDDFFMPADEFIAQYVSDRRLRDLLAYMSPMYGGIAGHTPAYVHALINVLYINGSSQFVDGSQQLADRLAEVIESCGGHVIAGDAVESVKVVDRVVEFVMTKSKKQYVGDWYISDVHPATLFALTGDGAFPRIYVNRIKEIPNSYSAFSVYIKFKPESYPYVNHPCYFQENYETVWNLGEYTEDSFPQGFMFITPPTHNQGPWANRMIINCVMPFDAVRQWEHTTIGHRGNDYVEWKERLTNKVIAKMDMLKPGFRDAIDVSFASSPLTIRDYYGVKEGSLYGHRCDCKTCFSPRCPLRPKFATFCLQVRM